MGSLLKNINFFFFIFYISLTRVVCQSKNGAGRLVIDKSSHTHFIPDGFRHGYSVAELSETVQFVARIRELLVCLYSEQVLNS